MIHDPRLIVDVEPLDEGQVFVWQAFNTSHRSILVLAKDKDMALNIAWAACHIRHTDSGLESEGRAVHQMRPAHFPDICAQLELATARRLQGTVRVDDEDVYVGHSKVTV